MAELESTKINYYWRIFGTGFSFVFFGLGGVFLALTLLPAVRLWPGTTYQRNRRARKVVHNTFRYFIWQMGFLGVNTMNIEGRQQLRETKGQLVIANHPSLIDVVILIACIPNCCCIVKQALWQNPFISGVVRWTGYISNSDPVSLIAECRKVLDEGCSIIVFPEGTRTSDASALKFQRGAANIAVRCKADILPVIIRPDLPTLRKGEPWYSIPSRCPVFSVKTLPPIEASSVVGEQAELSLATRQLNRYLQNYYQGLMCYA
ncbi:MAG: lysophospholipid acyltransferase family protein [Spongiibacteraceae bacterium]